MIPQRAHPTLLAEQQLHEVFLLVVQQLVRRPSLAAAGLQSSHVLLQPLQADRERRAGPLCTGGWKRIGQLLAQNATTLGATCRSSSTTPAPTSHEFRSTSERLFIVSRSCARQASEYHAPALPRGPQEQPSAHAAPHRARGMPLCAPDPQPAAPTPTAAGRGRCPPAMPKNFRFCNPDLMAAVNSADGNRLVLLWRYLRKTD